MKCKNLRIKDKNFDDKRDAFLKTDMSHNAHSHEMKQLRNQRYRIMTIDLTCSERNCILLQEHLSYFHFVGRILGMAIFHGHYLDGGFTMPLYKQLLGKPVTLEDLENVDPDLHRSLIWML